MMNERPEMTDTRTRTQFRKLHESGCFLLPNPWDIGSARRLEKLGFQAIATSSAACAWAIGKQDYELTLADSLAHLELMVPATGLPVNADFENGFSDTPEGVGDNVRQAVATGIAALSIEDRIGTELRDRDHARACIAASRAAIDASGQDVMLVARTEAYLVGRGDAGFAIDRLVSFADAGADVLFAPGVRDLAVVADMVRAVAPKPLNVLMMGNAFTTRQLADVGVRRISVGGALAKAAWAGFDLAAAEYWTSLPDQYRQPTRRSPSA
jgi:2-methylisocitrate lyase-like PEP mutase family enzyme